MHKYILYRYVQGTIFCEIDHTVERGMSSKKETFNGIRERERGGVRERGKVCVRESEGKRVREGG